MKRDTITINGVQLTRSQVEQALIDLNKPEPEPLRPFEPRSFVIRRSHPEDGVFVAPSTGVLGCLERYWPSSPGRQTVICTDGKRSHDRSYTPGSAYSFDLTDLQIVDPPGEK